MFLLISVAFVTTKNDQLINKIGKSPKYQIWKLKNLYEANPLSKLSSAAAALQWWAGCSMEGGIQSTRAWRWGLFPEAIINCCEFYFAWIITNNTHIVTIEVIIRFISRCPHTHNKYHMNFKYFFYEGRTYYFFCSHYTEMSFLMCTLFHLQ